MKGIAIKQDDKWIVKYPKHPTSNKIFETLSIEFHPTDQEVIESMTDKVVNFKIVDEFTNPELFKNISWGDSQKMAKLI